ncbi:MAG: tRNA 2-thiouridine(34) synthase MnmA [Candidatus Omnitrophica bacterium]|nr:tRNA 2-thiouridine(34) synthase MnmA [Candidatus Omnitrophota bacterium]
MNPKNRVIVAMSGGVDSSVAAWLLKEAGHDVIGVTIKTWGDDECRDEKSKGCCSLRDIDDARAVARKIGIPYYVMDLSDNFREKVIDYFVDEYLNGRTPNPCIECNRHIKFGVLLKKADELNAQYIATGHYARVGSDPCGQPEVIHRGLTPKRYFIREGVDLSKDQSYVLFGLTQEQLSRTLLPVGELHKKDVRAVAERLGLRVFDKPDSQEICFVKSGYGNFVKSYAPDRLPGEGAFVDEKGEILGRHEGSHLYTVGQRKRITIQNPHPYFVTGIDAEKNTVVLGREESLFTHDMTVHRVNWILSPRLGEVSVKIRSRHEKAPADITGIDKDLVHIRFKDLQKAVTPGQAAVFYDGDKVAGGGWIL